MFEKSSRPNTLLMSQMETQLPLNHVQGKGERYMEAILKDRYTRGLTAGLLAGVIALAWNLFSFYVLRFATLLWGDFVAALIFRRPVAAPWEYVFSMLIGVMFTGFLGVVFSLLIPVTKSRFLWLKGLLFGVAIWFLAYSLAIMFRIPTLTHIPSPTVLSNFIGASLWGLSLGIFLEMMQKRLQEQ